MSEKKNIETTRLVMENWNRYLDEGFMDKAKDFWTNRRKKAGATSAQPPPPQPVPGEDDFGIDVVDPDEDPRLAARVASSPEDQGLGPISDEEIEKMITDKFKSISKETFKLIQNNLIKLFNKIKTDINYPLKTFKFQPDEEKHKRLVNNVKQQEEYARQLTRDILERLKSALIDINNNPAGQNKDPGDLERAASVVNQRQLEETIDRVFSNFINEKFNSVSKKKIVIEVKRRK